jgi:hypothetical protein
VNRENKMARHPQRDKNDSSAGNVLPFGRTITGDIHSIQWQFLRGCASAAEALETEK